MRPKNTTCSSGKLEIIYVLCMTHPLIADDNFLRDTGNLLSAAPEKESLQ